MEFLKAMFNSTLIVVSVCLVMYFFKLLFEIYQDEKQLSKSIEIWCDEVVDHLFRTYNVKRGIGHRLLHKAHPTKEDLLRIKDFPPPQYVGNILFHSATDRDMWSTGDFVGYKWPDILKKDKNWGGLIIDA